ITDVDVLGVIDEGAVGEVPALFGEVKVTRQVIGFQRKLSSTQETIDEIPLALPPQTLVTKALWWLLPKRLLLRARITPPMLPGTAHAAEHAAIGLLPLVATCDRWDVGGLSTPFHRDTAGPTIFIYDGYPGGAGIAERGHESGARLLEATFEAVRLCPCARGCPNPYLSMAIPTGMGEARNTLIVRSSDALIAVAGEFGTLSEIAFALKIGVPVVGLATWELSKAGFPVEAFPRVSSPEEAVR